MAITTGEVTIHEKVIKYKATVAESFLPDSGKPAASVITISYEAGQPDTTNRPVIFLFNGGPGASSSPLHLHAFGPVRLEKTNDGTTQVSNVYSLLDVADLVFIDPAGTGFTKIYDTARATAYWDVAADAQCFIEIIKKWKREHHRTTSPVFMCGESYGTIRAVKILGLAENFPLKGVILFSADLDLSLVSPISGNEMPFVVSLPSMAAIAWYHKKSIYGEKTVQQIADEAASFSFGPYAAALLKGKDLPDPQQSPLADTLAHLTGLSVKSILDHHLRITSDDFEMLLLADRNLRIGKLDAQVTSPVPKEKKSYSSRDDPSLVVNTDLRKDFVGRYFTNTLKFPATGLYRGVNFDVNSRWQWASMDAYRGYYSVIPDLEQAMKADTGLRILVAGGLYDLATPVYATKYLLDQADLPMNRVSFLTFPTGHSIFEKQEELEKLSEAVRRFVLAKD